MHVFFTDNNQSHLFETSDKEDSLQNIPTNDQVLAADKASTNDETSDNRSSLSNTQQESDGRGSPDHVETREVEAIGRSTNVSTQHLQTSGKARNMTSESQMLLSGVQTIPEQLPLILTEGDAEEHESLAIIAGNEQLQVRMNVKLFTFIIITIISTTFTITIITTITI